MDIFFSDDAARDAAEYVVNNFPGRGVVLYAAEEYRNEFLRAGIRLISSEVDGAEKAVAVGIGSKENYRFARAENAFAYVLAGGVGFSEMISDFLIIGYRKIKSGYPKAVFIDTYKSEEFIREAALFAAESYLSLLDVCFQNGYVGGGKKTIDKAWELVREGSAEERVEFFSKAVSAVGRSEFSAIVDVSGGSHQSFTALALFTAIRFTNFSFSSILLSRDAATAVSVTGDGPFGIRPAGHRTPNLYMARKYLPPADEADDWCSAVFDRDPDPEEMLSVYAAAAYYSRENGFFAALWDVGFVDGLQRGFEYVSDAVTSRYKYTNTLIHKNT